MAKTRGHFSFATTTQVYKTILKLKWETFCTHPGSYSHSLVLMLLCQQRGTVPYDSEEVLENKSPINEASIERITRGKDIPILKEAEISKTRKGKMKANSKGTNLNTDTSLWRKMKNVKKLVNSINNRSLIMTKKRNLGTLKNVFERLIACSRMVILLIKRTLLLRRKLLLQKRKLLLKKNLLKIKKKKEEKDFVVNIVTAPELWEAADDVGVESKTEKQSEDHAKPKEKKIKRSKDKK
ncbi:hypothetical protein PVK06_030392 [Gossypium arboreum]|uniref:Uncharacterized protein n=1 Tax=Gossypium arboreum TaxID=29729 RepID=A0ABR0NN66_GOSAR|nr:hypothetical protein PVK06_030392 [Gossypium arboreum]